MGATYIPVNPSYGVDALHAAWYYADDLDAWWARLMKSLTNNIRITGVVKDVDHDHYDGIAWVQSTYIRVRWVWLILPAALVLMSMTFLVSTMVASSRGKTEPWKNRALATVYARLGDDLRDETQQSLLESARTLDDCGKQTVHLDDAGGAWTFRRSVQCDEKV